VFRSRSAHRYTGVRLDGETARGAIRILHREGIIDEETMQTLIAAIGFRNILAHEYGQIDTVETYETLQTGLTVYDTYNQQIAQWFRGRA
jgi:uncharacterized protein YutE (UPF0331/DUF86 family)